jgi:hypothetical protein
MRKGGGGGSGTRRRRILRVRRVHACRTAFVLLRVLSKIPVQIQDGGKFWGSEKWRESLREFLYQGYEV